MSDTSFDGSNEKGETMAATTGEAPSRSRALPEILAGIISAARRRAGVAALSDAALAEEIRDWQRILAPIPADRLEECELRAVRTRSVKALLQPQELLAAWAEIREADRAKRPPSVEARSEADQCAFCGGFGWQTFAYRGEAGNENTAARPCACKATPMEIRSLEPLREPEWQRRKHSAIWERVT